MIDSGPAAFMPADTAGEFRASAGAPLPEGAAQATEEDLVAALKSVYDPEIPVDIFELGLIYSFDRDEKGDIEVSMSLTAPGCPVAG